MPALHLVDYQGGLRLCEDRTGLLIGPTDRRLAAAGLYVANLRGEKHYAKAAKAADLRQGQRLRLIPEPDNPHDPYALAVFPARGDGPVGYVNKQKARAWSKLLTDGARWTTVSLRGTGPGQKCEAVAILSAAADVVAHLLAPRPAGLPQPAFLRTPE